MRAILLAAGLGSRLRPITDHIPKCLVKIGPQPLLGHWLDALFSVGVDEILINTHYLAEKVESYISKHPERARILLSQEKVLLGTAGTIRANSDFCSDGDTFVIHADNYCNANLADLIRAHRGRPRPALFTMLAHRVDTPLEFGIVRLNEKGILVDFWEKSKSCVGNLANSAIYIFSNAAITALSSEASYGDLSCDYLPKMTGKAYVYETSSSVVDIGTPKGLAAARLVYKNTRKDGLVMINRVEVK